MPLGQFLLDLLLQLSLLFLGKNIQDQIVLSSQHQTAIAATGGQALDNNGITGCLKNTLYLISQFC